MSDMINFPRQMISSKKKTQEWCKKCVIWADSKTFFNYSLVRKSVVHKKINYDLVDGKLHMEDVALILNPDSLQSNFTPEHLQHYPIMNSKLDVLRGEELKRPFDYRVIVTNPDAVSEIENDKKQAVFDSLQRLIESNSQSQEDFERKLEKLSDYYNYEWQDIREVRANQLLKHYVKEYNMPLLFNTGFMDGLIVGEEIYQCNIVGGEPTINRINPLKIRIFKSGYSNKIEDADVVILEDYWSPGKVIDTFYDELSEADMRYLEKLPDHVGQAAVDDMNNIDERYGFVNQHMIGEEFSFDNDFFFDPAGVQGITYSLLPYDLAGNVRVMTVYWKSKRKIQKVKSYNPETGEEQINFYSEDYMPDEFAGEESKTLWINEAWEGTMIGGRQSSDKSVTEGGIFVQMRPRPIQYNSLSNPSRCHFGIIGSIYNINDDRPYSLVDIMKVYNYMYDALHYRLNEAIASNWGDILELDLAKVPEGWDVQKWIYYAKINHLAVTNSFKEAQYGPAQGKIVGNLNNNSKGLLSTNVGNYIQQLMNLLEYTNNEMRDAVGITKQREGQVSVRETVGGIERSNMQSSYITERLFAIHDDVKRRALECFLETAKIALRGKSKKFQYILSDMSQRVIEIPGDEFAECDYGLVVDASQNTVQLEQKIESLAQAALQNQAIDLSAIMKLWSSGSLAEKQRIVERSEQRRQQEAQRAQQEQLQAQQQTAQQALQQKQMEAEQKMQMNQQDNETKILVAKINAQSQSETAQIRVQGSQQDNSPQLMSESDRESLNEQIREFNQKMALENKKLSNQYEIDKERNAISRQKKTSK